MDLNFKRFFGKDKIKQDSITPQIDNNSNKRNAGKGTCVWINEVGSIDYRIFDIIEEKGNPEVEIIFNPTETYKIKRSNIRGNRLLIFKLPSGKLVIQNPDKWRDLDLKSKGIKEFRFNLQNFSLQESKASIQRWTTPEDIIKKLTPWFKILIVALCVGVLGWYSLKFFSQVFTQVIGARTVDCMDLIPKIPVPLGSNVTVPLGK